jgi:hypothetical protein
MTFKSANMMIEEEKQGDKKNMRAKMHNLLPLEGMGQATHI